MSTALVPSHFSLHFAVRKNILAFPKYVTSTSDDVQERAAVLLDANENSAGSCLAPEAEIGGGCPQDTIDLSNLNRYPSASHKSLRQRIVQWRRLESIEQVCVGSGASDIIDVIIRATCTPGSASILVTPPTFDFYRVCARLHDVGVTECSQEMTADGDFRLPIDHICAALSTDERIKVVFLASPGNPTGSLIPLEQILRILNLKEFRGILVVDEAYIDFAAAPERASAVQLLAKYNNLIVVQSLSKSHGLAGIRVGMAMAHPILISMLGKVQMPYRLSSVTLGLACEALSADGLARATELQRQVVQNRTRLTQLLIDPALASSGIGPPLGGLAANFVLVPIYAKQPSASGACQRDDARAKRIVWRLRTSHDIAVRHVGGQVGCSACVRITVGTVSELKALHTALRHVAEC
ncbi:PLP-dependent transferase [Dothidotthia symphoricarpi CBS 119687]|uniref:histidinol-phosphate transaminase n=1 Tax=Dothidotthia symphoricarpi CBS 119687 TaxID=1392245 RepID=A0A6A6AAV1_9PLEO|nr:PLP-dependent transferase [Dothidotthia symphoricarpi CBS 119687]KAF2128275.1 PLP-dependent transferase [Dothidotthia symphoricarpi CBS 119687]